MIPRESLKMRCPKPKFNAGIPKEHFRDFLAKPIAPDVVHIQYISQRNPHQNLPFSSDLKFNIGVRNLKEPRLFLKNQNVKQASGLLIVTLANNSVDESVRQDKEDQIPANQNKYLENQNTSESKVKGWQDDSISKECFKYF